MQRVLTVGRDLEIINTLLKQYDFELVTKNPDIIVTHGGDGYLLQAELQYPGLPKLPIRRNSICKNCVDHDATHALKALAEGTISQTVIPKLEAVIDGQTEQALNEFSLHHQKPNQAIRFSVQINREERIELAIGDGLIIATPFGSHAYYRSITKSTFRVGIGLAFNNTTEPIDHTVIGDSDTVTVTIHRGPAYWLADNKSGWPLLEAGQSVVVRQGRATTTILGLDHFRCPDCNQSQVAVNP